MKKLSVGVVLLILCVFTSNSAFAQRFWVASTTGNWSNTANWSNVSGGAGGFSVPGPGDVVTFNGARVGNCNVDINPGTINGLTILGAYTGSINLNNFTLTVGGAGSAAPSGGTINGGTGSLAFNTTGTATFAGTVFNVPITGTVGKVIFNGGTFNQSVNLIKTAASDDDGTGNNTFAAAVTLQNNSANRIRMATTNRDIFNGPVTAILNNTGVIELAYGSTTPTQFNDNLVVNYLTTASFRLGTTTGKSTMASGKTLTVTSAASGAGGMTLGGITFNSAQTIALTGNTTSAMSIRNAATFNGNTSLTAGSYQIATGVFNGPLSIEKTGPSTDDLTGGNTFASVNALNSGDGQFNWAATNPDTFNGDVTFTNTAGGRIQLVINSTGTVVNGTLTTNHGGSTAGINNIFSRNTGATLTINGNVFLNETNADGSSGIIMGNDGSVVINGNVTMTSTSGRGVLFAQGAGSTVTIGANGNNYALSATPSGFTAGVLSLQQTNIKGTATQTVETGGTAQFNIGSLNVFEGPVDFKGRQITLDASDFRANTSIEKTGAGDNGGLGGSTFAGPTLLRNSGSGAWYTNNGHTFNGSTKIQNTGANYISMEHAGTGSTYNGPVEFTNAGSSQVRVSRTGNTIFNDNIVVVSSGGTGILFCETGGAGTATAVLATGKTITTTGFTAGELRLQYFTQQGPTNQSLTFVYPGLGLLTLGPASTFNGNVTFSAPRVLLHGTTYNGTANITKTGGTNDLGSGANLFQGAVTIANSGSAVLTTGDINPDTFNGVLTVNNTGSSTIRLADTALGTLFNNNIILNTSAGNGIYFSNGNGSSTLANDKTITAGSVLTGDIRIIRMTQTSSVVPQTLNLSGIAILTVGPGTLFGGDIDFRAPQLLLNGCTYGTNATNTIRLEKTGATNNDGIGGNVFNGVTTIVNSGSAILRSAAPSPGALPDVANANLFLNNTSSGAINLSYTAPGNVYNGNIQFTNALGGAGITFGQNGGTSTLSNGGALSIGAAGFISGDLRFMRFTQVGTTAQTLILTPPASGVARLRVGPASSFDGVVDFRSPRVLLEGATYNNTTSIEKLGATDDASAGGNIFNGVTTFKNSGTGWFINADVALDQFNNDLTLTNTNSAGIRMADNVPGSLFKGDITVNSTFGQGIWFCDTNAAATATLSAGKVIKLGGTGFTVGELRLRRFTTLGTTAQTIALGGTTTTIRLGPNSDFGGDVNFKAPQLYLNQNSIYRGVGIFEKTGATDNTGTGLSTFMGVTSIKNSGTGYLRTNGGNVFNGPTTLTNTNSNDLLLELTTGSTYNDDVAIVNSGSSQVRVGYTGTTAFNGNITLSSTAGTGINFGETATNINLADTKTISVTGGGAGFTNGILTLSHFNQLGTGTPQALTLNGGTLVFTGNTTFNSDLTALTPRVFLNGAIFQGTTIITKTTSVATDISTGGNQFNGTTTITNTPTGTLRLASTTADTYGGNVTFVRAAANSGSIEPAYVGNNTFAGNVTVQSSIAIIFGASTGTQTFTGSNTQTIAKVGGVSPQFNRLVVNKAANGITLNTDIAIGNSANFVSGVITSTSTSFINFLAGATTSGASNASYVSGPVRKTGTDNFSFPTGKNGIYKTIGISSVASNSQFIAEYFNAAQTAGSTMGPGLDHVSACEHWIMTRNSGSATPTVTLSWRNADCAGTYVVNTTDLRVASYNTTLSRWEDRGQSSVSGTGGGLPGEGIIVSNANVAIFGAFALATSTSSNPLPISLQDFTAANMGSFVTLNWTTATEINNESFTIERSSGGGEFKAIKKVAGHGNSTSVIKYIDYDEDPLPGISYYRLMQTDYDHHFTYSDVVKVNRDEEPVMMVSPNPMDSKKLATLNFRGTFQVINSVGQIMMIKENAKEFDVTGLSPGVYLIRSTTGQVCRLIIN